MNLFERFRKRTLRGVVLGLDGAPYSLLQRLMAEGRMPNLSRLAAAGSLWPMASTLPSISSVAWASIVTGCNPGKHNIFGFVDRVPQTHEMFIPTSRNLMAKTWVELFSGMGKRVFSMGVPTTYPPRAVNGVLISGFLAPDLKKATYPLQVAAELEAMGYQIDIDAWQAREDRDRFLDEVFNALERRLETMLRFWERGPWDLFVAHIIDTDRLHHFLWGYVEEGSERYTPWFLRFYERIDEAIGELAARMDEDVVFMIVSDHGFCRLRREVHLNYWLRQAGFLQFAHKSPMQIRDLAATTRCYSLLPGRFYICLRGRERNGCVAPGADYESVRRDVAAGLVEIRDPESGERAIEKVLMREELYRGPACDLAPDLVAVPAKGYDLKGGFEKTTLMEASPVSGTHTLDDAVFLINCPGLSADHVHVTDVMPTLFGAMGLSVPEAADGRRLSAGDGR